MTPVFLSYVCRRFRKTMLDSPAEVLHLVMERLTGNQAVRLGSAHPALRVAFNALPELQLDVQLSAEVRARALESRSSSLRFLTWLCRATHGMPKHSLVMLLNYSLHIVRTRHAHCA